MGQERRRDHGDQGLRPALHDIMDLPPQCALTTGTIVGNLPGPIVDSWSKISYSEPTAARRLRWRRSLVRVFWLGCALGALLYSALVFFHVARMGTIGVRCMFGTTIEEEIPS